MLLRIRINLNSKVFKDFEEILNLQQIDANKITRVIVPKGNTEMTD